jgi:hypothetical protein
MLDLAERLQDQFFLETAEAWGQPRPPCPGHGRPVYPRGLEGVPYWLCPADHVPVAPIGQLGSATV